MQDRTSCVPRPLRIFASRRLNEAFGDSFRRLGHQPLVVGSSVEGLAGLGPAERLGEDGIEVLDEDEETLAESIERGEFSNH